MYYEIKDRPVRIFEGLDIGTAMCYMEKIKVNLHKILENRKDCHVVLCDIIIRLEPEFDYGDEHDYDFGWYEYVKDVKDTYTITVKGWKHSVREYDPEGFSEEELNDKYDEFIKELQFQQKLLDEICEGL